MATAATLTTDNSIGVVPVRVKACLAAFTSVGADTYTFSIACNRIQKVIVHDETNNALRICTITANAVSVAGVQATAVHSVYAFCD